jgi:hypothetical protein
LGTIVAAFLLCAQESPVIVSLPAGAFPGRTYRLVRESDRESLPVQVVGDQVVWMDAPGDKREYRLEEGLVAPPPSVACTFERGKFVIVRARDKEVLRYNWGVQASPPGVDPLHDAAGYLHPVWAPSGRIVSNDFPGPHPHHHGIWFCWRDAEFEGRKLNAFAPLEKVGRVEVVDVEGLFSGPVAAGFRARQRLVDPNAPGGPKAALEDAWDVRVYATPDEFLIDVTSTQTCKGGSPVTVLKKYYGGMSFRGSAEWEGKAGVAFLTSEGKTRVDGNGLPARWVAMNGKIGGKDAGVGLLGHPGNFRAPQPTRLNPSEPFFCWVPGADAGFKIEPGKPFVSRYRFVIADRALTAAEMERHWTAYAQPAKGVTLRLR